MSDSTSEFPGALDGTADTPPTPPPAPPVPPVEPAEDPGDSLLARFKARVSRKETPPVEAPEAPQVSSAPTSDALLNYAGLETDFGKMFDQDDRAGAMAAFQKVLTETARAAYTAANEDSNKEIDKRVKSERSAQRQSTEDQENTQLVQQYIMGQVGDNEGIYKMIVPMFLEHLNELTGGDASKEPDNIKKAMTMAKKTFGKTVDLASVKKNPDSGTASARGSTPQNKPQEDSFDSFLADYSRAKSQE